MVRIYFMERRCFGMEDAAASAFFSKHKQEIMETWSTEFGKLYPKVYSKAALDAAVSEDFNYVFEMQTPAHDHPLFHQGQEVLSKPIEFMRPIIQIVESSRCWKNVIVEIVEKYDHTGIITISHVHKLNLRIDLYVNAFYRSYTNRSEYVIKSKDTLIRELHDDRISLIGKMAASMAHEIRNPLTSIRGFLKLLRSNISPVSLSKVERYIKIIEDEFENINMQITGFLSFSKNRLIEESFVRVSIEQLVESVLSLLGPRLISEDVILLKDINRSHFVQVQKTAVQQVISNIINNGVDALSAVVDSKMMQIFSIEQDNCIYLHISNNGPEVLHEMKDTLFSPFVTDKIDGTGLGLAICQKIMSSNNGGITYTSTAEKTTFIISFNENDK